MNMNKEVNASTTYNPPIDYCDCGERCEKCGKKKKPRSGLKPQWYYLRPHRAEFYLFG